MRTPATAEEEQTWRAIDGTRKALITDLGRSWSEAGRLLATAKALSKDAPTADALRAGVISAPQARIIADTLGIMGKVPDTTVDLAREDLIAQARASGTDSLRLHVADAAHRRTSSDVRKAASVAQVKCRFTMTPTVGGYVPGGFLPTAGAEAVLTVLDALAAIPSAEDENGQATVRADALIRLAEERLRAGDLPSRHGGPTAMTIVMRADTALGLPDAPPAHTAYGQYLPAAEAHMFACEAALRAVLVNSKGEILWQGRKHRFASQSQYDALAVRDCGCTSPGCFRPAHECDAHHDKPWSQGGLTDVNHMRLLCRKHHREVHDELRERQFGWQDAKARALKDGEAVPRPRRPSYTDSPAWYPGPGPGDPEGLADAPTDTLTDTPRSMVQ